ncbi:hypothetical protein LuPra_01368 [Luteitalea pratensis]|uniref:Uncharacterized protein n=1 Tax=Luteitalea pratensis TaxID=1855912 RepID=A0A143PIE4_LUTPR|nr:hypothetical protein [Luteitalea pratensis]AMY08176.1 hypothetical protein LuPra_01368 [Luteitalea pratensis]
MLVANTSTYAGRAKLTLYFEDGQTLEHVYTLLPKSRMTAAIGQDSVRRLRGSASV